MASTYIIAEIGNTHEGSVGLAQQFIRSAAACGVDAVKFQTHLFDAESLPDAPNPPYFKDETRKEYLERTAFSAAQWKVLKQCAEDECGVDFLSSPFSIEAVEILEEVGVQTYKVPSGEVTNLPLLIRIAKTGKRVLLSSGMSDWDELDRAVEILKAHGCSDLVMLQCTSEYPCPPEHSGLNVMEEMQARYGLPAGYSDHTEGLSIPVAAVVKGAVVIEKHFTLSNQMYGSDAGHSTEPDEFKRLVDEIRAVESALGARVDKQAAVERFREMKKIFEKSIVAACDIEVGTTVEARHLAYKKPGDGIPSAEFDRVLGRTLKEAVSRNHPFTWDDFE